jgi:CTP:molybdopterin cytidylyltransferase MocA
MGENRFGALILAAGESSRMGRTKALLPLGTGTPSALHGIVRCCRKAGIDDIAVVTGHHWQEVEPAARNIGIAAVRNPHPEDGMLSSARCGLASARTATHVLILPVDVPLVRPMTLRTLMDRAAERPETVLVPTFAGQEGHPPLLPLSLRESVLAHDGEGGLRGILSCLPREAVPVADSLILEDMDTPDDYRRLCGLAAAAERLAPDEAMRLLELRGTSLRGRTHGLAVGTVARAFAQAFARAGGKADPELAFAAGTLHDICKGEPSHERAGGTLLREMGLTELAPLVQDHRDLSLPDAAPITERELVYLADKYCHGGAFVPLAMRFGRKMAMYRDDPAALQAIRGRLERARCLADRLGRELGEDVAGIARTALEQLQPLTPAAAGDPAPKARQAAR